MKGIIFEIDGEHTVVMLGGGHFVSAKTKPDWRIGDTVTMPRQTHRRKAWYAAAACFALAASLSFGGYGLYYSQESLVSMDVNPSIELGINRFDRVISVTARNPEADQIVNAVDVRNMTYTGAVAALASGGGMDPYLTNDASMLFTVQTKNTGKQAVLLKNLREAADAAVLPHHRDVTTECFAVDEQTVSSAHQHGMTAGKYTVLMELQQVAPEIDIAQYSHCSIGEIKGQISMHSESGRHSGGAEESAHGGQH